MQNLNRDSCRSYFIFSYYEPIIVLYCNCFVDLLTISVRLHSTSENGNLRNLRYTKNLCHMMLALLTSESAHPIIQVEQAQF